MPVMAETTWQFRHPCLQDGTAITQLIAQSPPLDLNSSYLYFLQSTHFADTCLLAEKAGQLQGFISGYVRPDQSDELFIWQVAVAKSARGQGLASILLHQLLTRVLANSSRPIFRLSCTIGPSNLASQTLFRRFAERHQLQVKIQDFLQASDFAGTGHEAENLWQLQAPNAVDLRTYLTTHS
ncbi:MAG: diaminobutyrate acetyltransferase [Thiotrichales bacterium]|nr:diaminobutyrate acetyltransferase [Thiotrichales bacterium]